MNILVIGNGFDLAHGLPTKYTDFLGFVERFENLKKSSMIMSNGGLSNTAKPIYEYLDKLIFENRKLSFELDKLISSNIWIKYLLVMISKDYLIKIIVYLILMKCKKNRINFKIF